MPHSNTTIAMWLGRVLGHEMGHSLDPDDHGNWTGGKPGLGELKGSKFGISAKSYPELDIANLTVDDAIAIYQEDFLVPVGVDSFEDGVAYQLFDFAVNSGPGTAVRQLQEALGVVPDGDFGPRSYAALKQHSESDLIFLLNAERIEFMVDAPTFATHGRGWLRRIAKNLRYAAVDS